MFVTMSFGNNNGIRAFYVKGLWKEKEVRWENINPDVNILVGINGSGKTTLMNLMYAYYWDSKLLNRIKWTDIEGSPLASDTVMPEAVYVKNLDVPTRRKEESPLLQELNNVVFQNKQGVSFFNYRMKMLDYPERYDDIKSQIEQFGQLVNRLFEETGKTMMVRESRLMFKTAGGHFVELADLSSGEKQLLLILLKVFLLEGKPAVIFMDEPEISLHIGWQQQLLDVLTAMNSQSQYFLTTHSPSMFGRGWGDKVVYMEDIIRDL